MMTPIKCFRHLAGAFYVEDWSGQKRLYCVVFDEDAAHWIRKALKDIHKRPVLEWDEEYNAEATRS